MATFLFNLQDGITHIRGTLRRNAIYNRDWLYVSEVQDLSDYAGYDLLTGQRLPDK